jgi:septum formation protein
LNPSNALVLASKSAARAAVLAGAGLSFRTVGAGVDETPIKAGMVRRGASPREIARVLSEEKAKAGSVRNDGLVIGADQTLDLDGTLIDKADSLAEARARLLDLRGRSHQLHSGVAVARADEILFTHVETATLTVRGFSEAWLDAYLERNGLEILGSVGCYLLEGEGVQLFERVEGDYFTILGLPLLPLLAFLRQARALDA